MRIDSVEVQDLVQGIRDDLLPRLELSYARAKKTL